MPALRASVVACEAREVETLSKPLLPLSILGRSQKGKEMRQIIDMTGQRFGRWTVLGCAGCDKHKQAMWLCRCGCGKELIVVGYNLRRGKSQGCRSCAATTHGENKTKLYRVWVDMRKRCYNKNSSGYKYYGGRGVSVCKEWAAYYETFRDWALENGYRRKLTIDRINNGGNYEPNNCRFVTMKQQQRNKRSNRLIAINGIKRTIAEWAEIAGVKYATLWDRVNRGWCEERLLAPLRGGNPGGRQLELRTE